MHVYGTWVQMKLHVKRTTTTSKLNTWKIMRCHNLLLLHVLHVNHLSQTKKKYNRPCRQLNQSISYRFLDAISLLSSWVFPTKKRNLSKCVFNLPGNSDRQFQFVDEFPLEFRLKTHCFLLNGVVAFSDWKAD